RGKSAKSVGAMPPEEVKADYNLPSSWLWMELGKLVTVMDAGWSPQCESHPRRDPAQWGVLKTTAVQTLAFDCGQHKELPARYPPRPQHEARIGDILVTRAGPKNRVGISCVVDQTEPRLMISDKLIRFRLIDGLSPRFFALTLNAGVTSSAIEDAKSGMAVMQMNISQDKLRAVPVPLPPLAEQHRIVAKVDALMATCDKLEASLTTTSTTRLRLLDALLQEPLTPVSLEEAA
ncbi:MAG: restriction endonuclease subunit S, partial [Actinomycetota bacterium]|nr:restriction endonuclease subunit S [Actinomycetota bacterium]